MGCDIHVYPEKRNAAGVWEPLYGELIPCSECDGTLWDPHETHCANCKRPQVDHEAVTDRCLASLSTWSEVKVPCNSCNDRWTPPGKWEHWDQRIYSGRNYRLFGVLANVRGTPDSEFTQANRDLPDDCCDQLSNEYESWGDDGHSATYYTLAELLAYPWSRRGFSDFGDSVERLKARSASPDYDDVRLTIWFDN